MWYSNSDRPEFTVQLYNLVADWVTLGKLHDCLGLYSPKGIPWNKVLRQKVYLKGDPRKHWWIVRKWGREWKEANNLRIIEQVTPAGHWVISGIWETVLNIPSRYPAWWGEETCIIHQGLIPGTLFPALIACSEWRPPVQKYQNPSSPRFLWPELSAVGHREGRWEWLYCLKSVEGLQSDEIWRTKLTGFTALAEGEQCFVSEV